ncbi:MarR family winged helix-turn-helix transcriptional regulator [Marinomonas pontica]|uniref:MarR family winged helix-turn-helix transcriptional regulator n=1 Tax=Marinomonas pontica TaxID=264739 RepID=UPI0022443BD1|nr:MarR family winged helix-turn-helix transcriptional regulator [Marinomonas pontica]MCW8355097.1 MarR family winged helix-turn-helix transcriptional regulator [Marinomonas pontica]
MNTLFGDSLHTLMHSYRNQLRESAVAAGISIPVSHIRTLKCISKIHNCSAKDIANKLSLDKSQVTRTLKELVNEGYVDKKRSPCNHRTQLLTLTQTGNELLNDLIALDQATVQNMTQNLSQQQIEDFIRIAETMVSNLSPSGISNK